MNHFFDIGACIGQTFDDYLCKSPAHDGWKVWCFEPSVRHIAQLCARIDREKARYRIVLCPFGISGQSTTAPFYPRAADWQGDSFEPEIYTLGKDDHLPLANLDTGYEFLFPMVSLPEFILRHTAPEDSIEIKMDCEGGEYAALPALLACPTALARVSALLVEFHDNGPGWYNRLEELKARYAGAGKPIQDWRF